MRSITESTNSVSDLYNRPQKKSNAPEAFPSRIFMAKFCIMKGFIVGQTQPNPTQQQLCTNFKRHRKKEEPFEEKLQ